MKGKEEKEEKEQERRAITKYAREQEGQRRKD
jgi:hypothetical protein